MLKKYNTKNIINKKIKNNKNKYNLNFSNKIKNKNNNKNYKLKNKKLFYKIKEKIISLVFINNKNPKIQSFDFNSGAINEKDQICPAYINNLNPRFLEIDNMFYAGLIVCNYYREQSDLLLKTLIETNINMNISVFYEKQDQFKTIKDLTYYIGNVGVELKDGNQNREDIDLAAFTYNDAKYIRKEMQINNEDLYFLYIYINVFSEDEKELDYSLNKIEGIAQSKGMKTRKANFREEQLFLSTIPLMENNIDLKDVAKRNVLTGGLLSTYPFVSSSIFDENGIFIGKNIYNNSLVFIDRYNTKKYKNANMCIFGTSGAGKSFFTKLLILRNRLFGIEQYIIDPDREYLNLCKELKGTEIKIRSFF